MKNNIKTALGISAAVIAVGAITVGSVFMVNASAEKNSIGSAAATQIALNDAGIAEADAQNLRSRFEREDGRYIFDVEFVSGNARYDYHIDASLGTVLERDVDGQNDDRDGNASLVVEQEEITLDEAKVIALEDAGVSENEVTFVKAKLDRDDGRNEYDIKFIANGNEYEYEISAQNGKILESDIEQVDGPFTNASTVGGAYVGEASRVESKVESKVETVSRVESAVETVSRVESAVESRVESAVESRVESQVTSRGTNEYMSADKAVVIALEHAGVNESEVIISKKKLEKDDGRYEYDIEFYKGNIEYEYEIDAISGEILDFDSEYDDD